MSFAYNIARRIHFSKGNETQRVSPPAIRIAIAGIAIGLVVMILSVAIVVGFKQEIREKVIGFGGHIQIHAMANNSTYEKHPICPNDTLFQALSSVEGIEKISRFITKPAVLKTQEDFLAVVIKGEEGIAPREVKVSQLIADKLNLSIGDKINLYFIQNNVDADRFALGAEDASIKSRQLKIAEIYSTGFNEYDKQMVYGNLETLQGVNEWEEDMVSGLEINISDFSSLNETTDQIIMAVNGIQDRRGTFYFVQTIEQMNPQVFAWLDLLDTNVWVILILMTIVASFTMISGLLIIILERTNMIGVLKAMGCNNSQLQKIFLYVSCFLIGKGLLIGNVIGIGICLLQKHFHLIALDPDSYYLEWVPIALDAKAIIILNIGTIAIALHVMMIPSSLVARISPVKAIQSE